MLLMRWNYVTLIFLIILTLKESNRIWHSIHEKNKRNRNKDRRNVKELNYKTLRKPAPNLQEKGEKNSIDVDTC